MSAAKLRLGPLPKTTAVKITITMPEDLKAMLDHYAAQHSQTYGEPVDAASLVPYMLEAFMSRDRAFKGVRAKAARPSSPV